MAHISVDIPSSWRTIISSWRWVIFTWTIDIGSLILGVIDFLLAWLNWVISLAETALDFTIVIRDWVVELWDWLYALILSEIAKVWDSLLVWVDELGEWFDVLKENVIDIVKAIIAPLTAWISELRLGVMSLIFKWDDFIRFTLPTLASLLDIEVAIKQFQDTWRDFFNFWGSFGKDVTAFFSDPLQWVDDRMEEFFDRFW